MDKTGKAAKPKGWQGYFSVYKKILLSPDKAFSEPADTRSVLKIWILSSLVYSVLVVASNMALIYITGAYTTITGNLAVFAGAIFAAFLAGALLVTIAYMAVMHVFSLIYARKASPSDTFRIIVAGLVPVYLFTWLSPLLRALILAVPLAAPGNAGLALAGQAASQIMAVLFGSFSVWFIWALLIQLFGFSVVHKAGLAKAIPLTLISSIVLLVLWSIISPIPLQLVQMYLGY